MCVDSTSAPFCSSHPARLASLALTFGATVLAGTAQAAPQPLDLPNVPIYLGQAAVPNLFINIDDSGSMNSELLLVRRFQNCAYDVNAWGGECDGDSTGDTTMDAWNADPDVNSDAETIDFEYIFDTPDNREDYGCTRFNRTGYPGSGTNDDRGAAWSCVQEHGEDVLYRQDWRYRTAPINVVFFDPNIDYQPWPDVVQIYDDQPFDAARSHPHPNATYVSYGHWSGLEGYDFKFDLGSYQGSPEGDGFFYDVWIDDGGFEDSRPKATGGTDYVPGANGIVDLWDSHLRVTVSDAAVIVVKVTYAPDENGLNESVVAPTAAEIALATGGKSDAELRQDIANWFTYYRRRKRVANGSLARALTSQPDLNYGLSYINKFEGPSSEKSSRPFLPIPTPFNAMVDTMLAFDRNSGTPLRGGYEMVGKYFEGTLDVNGSVQPSPITSQCQKNFQLMLTDGMWTDDSSSDVWFSPGDDDGDGYSSTLADIAKYYYDNDLAPGLADEVPTDDFDTASHQHINLLAVAFGVATKWKDGDGDGWPDQDDDGVPLGFAPAESDTWGACSPWSSTTCRMDDAWHGAYNSRGAFYDAQNPQQLEDALIAALDLAASAVSSSAAVTVEGGSASDDRLVFQALFATEGWSGDLLALDAEDLRNGTRTIEWSAGDWLDSQSDSWFQGTRNIVTSERTTTTPTTALTATGRDFVWSSPDGLTSDQQDALNRDSGGTVDNNGASRLLFLRGSKQDEVGAGGADLFREREHRLGDIINSAPVFVGPPHDPLNVDSAFQSFASSNAGRNPVVYVGANDGMLHAFDAATGAELFAYVPAALIDRLPRLSALSYDHRYYVDGHVAVADVEIGGSWRTVLVGFNGHGGQSMYVLDVTDPTSFDRSDVLFELSDLDDPDLGYVIGQQAQIRKMENGKYAAIFGNGYNNTENDGRVPARALAPGADLNDGLQDAEILFNEGSAALFVVYLDGSGYAKLDTGSVGTTTPNGLSAPSAIDWDGNGAVDHVYAGDLNGDVWSFDLTAANDASWSVGYSGLPMFDGSADQPITTRPAVAVHPEGRAQGTLVYVGTGKYLERSDDAQVGVPAQAIYAVNDRQLDGTSQPSLSVASLEARTLADSGSGRVLSGADIDWSTDRGWWVALPDAGERIIQRPVLRNDRVFMVSSTPAPGECTFGGSSWLMAFDAGSGLHPGGTAVIDADGDGDVDDDDLAAPSCPGCDADPMVGTEFDELSTQPSFEFVPEIPVDNSGNPIGFFPPRPGTPRGCGTGARDYAHLAHSDGNVSSTAVDPGALPCGRASWRQLK